MTKANINNVKIGDKAYVEVEIRDIKEESDYPIITNVDIFTKEGLRINNVNISSQLYIKEEILTIGEGVEMMVSDYGDEWYIRNVVAKTKKGKFITSNPVLGWELAKPIELTIEEQLANAKREIEKLKKQLDKK